LSEDTKSPRSPQTHHRHGDQIGRAFKSPTGEVVPHPALDPTVASDADRRYPLDKIVFGISAVIALGFVAWGLLSTDSLSSASSDALTWVTTTTGWLFVLTASFFVVFVIWLAASRYGSIPLGNADEEPEFKTVSWIAMMFSAGMGIGLMFWGVAEPMNYIVTPPPGTGADPLTPEAVEHSMATTMFHWTLHPWAIYAVVGLAIAYGAYRKGRKQLISSTFSSLLGRHADGPAGKVIDILAIFATLFGSATSLGLGALQIKSGLQIVGDIGSVGNAVLIAIIAILTACFILSAVSGVAKGIQWLSNINMVLALLLAVFVFVVGPTVFILNLVPNSLGDYLQDLALMAGRTGAEGTAAADWLAGWTVFYWAWWISWTPFVGMFIARISRGRTIRQFVTGVLLVPSMVSVVWFCIFGGAAVHEQINGDNLGKVVDGALTATNEEMLFGLLDTMPWATLTSIIVMVLVAIFFVSGADAASIVMGTLAQRGTQEPGRLNVIFWGVATGAVAAVALSLGDEDDPGSALTGLQNLTIVAALPFVIIMVGMAVALMKDLRHDPMMVRQAYAREAVKEAVITGVTQHGDDFALAVEPTEGSDGHSDAEVVEPDDRR